jgi:hypothetical protein
MYEFQVYNPTSRHYRTVATGSKDAMLLNMTLPHLHEGNRRRVRAANGTVLVKR